MLGSQLHPYSSNPVAYGDRSKRKPQGLSGNDFLQTQTWERITKLGGNGPGVLTPNWPRDPELFLDRSDARNNRVRNNHPT